VTLACSSAIFEGTELRKKQVGKYVCRRQEPKKRYRRRSTFGVGLNGEKWVNYLEQYSDEVEQLIKLTRNESRFDRQGMRAATLIRSISIASLSPPQASPRAIMYRKVEQAPSPPFDFEFPLGGKLAMEA